MNKGLVLPRGLLGVEEGALVEGLLGREAAVRVDGEEARDRLGALGAFIDCDAPDLVLLDLNLPKIDGREVLRRVKADTRLKSSPVLILSTSSSESDVITCYADHANAYLTKPYDPGRYEEVIAAIDAFWCSAATLPGPPPVARP